VAVNGPTGACHPDERLATTGQLARFLGGDATSFTGLLLDLIAKADPPNRRRLGIAFPETVATWAIWMATEPAPTAGELAQILAELRAIGRS
jgi:hypothetical protein